MTQHSRDIITFRLRASQRQILRLVTFKGFIHMIRHGEHQRTLVSMVMTSLPVGASWSDCGIIGGVGVQL